MLIWGKKTYVMGILNITPDSFSGDGSLAAEDPLAFTVQKAREFVKDGADILDIGAESSRPGAKPISTDQEISRLLPVLKALREENIPAILSIDTYKAEVAEVCLANGADWINDIWGLQQDPAIAAVAAAYQAPVVLMHNRSSGNAIQKNARLGASYDGGEYTNFLQEIKSDLCHIANTAISAGILKENIILDPGIGFGKTVSQNLELVNCLDAFKSLGYPILIGPSRKSFIGRVLDLPVEDRVEGTAAAIAISIARGAEIIRVHDVKFMARLARMADAILSGHTSAM